MANDFWVTLKFTLFLIFFCIGMMFKLQLLLSELSQFSSSVVYYNFKLNLPRTNVADDINVWLWIKIYDKKPQVSPMVKRTIAPQLVE